MSDENPGLDRRSALRLAGVGGAAFTVDPGNHPGATTRIHVTYHTVARPDGPIKPLETFVLQRPRSDKDQ